MSVFGHLPVAKTEAAFVNPNALKRVQTHSNAIKVAYLTLFPSRIDIESPVIRDKSQRATVYLDVSKNPTEGVVAYSLGYPTPW